ncbi:MAG: alpha-glucosidase/alpha-galactosidase [Thermoprotei archaeon]|nr:alpha-glucosidase/alpha-galactosidase [Thermoprotei archaeon]
MVKIAIIGAGSAAWSSRIVVDLILTPSLYGSEVALMDIDEDRLNLIHGFSVRYTREYGANIKFTKTRDRREAIRDADFIVNVALAKGHGFYERLREISEAHGYYRGINSVEWNMVADYPTIWGYYQFKLALDIARDIEELSPGAWLIQIANPVFELTTLISRETKVKTIGLCHGHLGYLDMAKTLGLNPEDAHVEMIGFNHVIWLTKFKYKGEDAYPLIDEWIAEKAEEYWEEWRKTQWNPFDIQMSPAAIDMYKVYGLFPIGDTVRGGTWKYHWSLETKQFWYGPSGGPDSEIGRNVYLEYLKMGLRELRDALADPSKPLAETVPPVKSGETLVPLINSIVNDEPGTYQVNVINGDSIPGIPSDVAVEMPAVVDGRGVHRLSFNGLPQRIMKYVMMLRLMRAEWAIQAFKEGGRDSLFEWLIIDPRTRSTSQVNNVIDAILKVPGNEEMARHFS